MAHPHAMKEGRGVILNVLVKNLAMKSKARCFAITLSMTTVAVQTVYDLPGFPGTPQPRMLPAKI